MEKYIGCSGYYYPAWIGKFYPAHLPRADRLRFYAQHFNAIEINSSFYKVPTIKSLQKRQDITAADFSFVLKVPKTITHEKKLDDIYEELEGFIKVAEQGLHEKIKCFLFQMPPSFHYSEENLARVLAISKHKNIDYAFEFRHKSRWIESVYKELEDKGFIFCSVSHPTMPETIIPADKQYIRFHGKEELYKSAYGENALKIYADNIKDMNPKISYIFFNNTWYGAALDDIKILISLI